VRDRQSFDAFYQATYRRTLHRVYALTTDLGESQDCAQEAYVRAWQRWGAIADYGDPEGWVRLVACRIATSRWHKARNAATALVRLGRPPAPAEPGPDTVAVVAALRALPAGQREALVLYHLCDLPVEEVARELRVPVGTVKARLARGRAALAPLLADGRVPAASLDAVP
jgi:RNA polymerase sigma-70 factor (ECF subfamily)